jgi:hypothetical protein
MTNLGMFKCHLAEEDNALCHNTLWRYHSWPTLLQKPKYICEEGSRIPEFSLAS